MLPLLPPTSPPLSLGNHRWSKGTIRSAQRFLYMGVWMKAINRDLCAWRHSQKSNAYLRFALWFVALFFGESGFTRRSNMKTFAEVSVSLGRYQSVGTELCRKLYLSVILSEIKCISIVHILNPFIVTLAWDMSSRQILVSFKQGSLRALSPSSLNWFKNEFDLNTIKFLYGYDVVCVPESCSILIDHC